MKLALLIIITLLLAGQTKAQRRLPGQMAVQATAGFTDFKKTAYHVGTSLSHYTLNGNEWIYGVEYVQKNHCYKHLSIPLSQITAEGGYYYNFWSNPGKDTFFSCGLSALAGYETINWNTKQFPDGATLENKDSFIYGAALTLEIETFVYDRLAILINVRERFLGGSSVQKFHNQIGIGIRYIYK